ncbi:MAG TPA: hypothetical protein VGR45_17775 [Stellaceae bacterium]|nr:hypothetical protein [Stellaceae bacterium]
MMKVNLALMAMFVGCLTLTVSPAGAQQSVTCTGTLAPGTYNNVNVPTGASCTLSSPIAIIGNIIVAARATLLPATGMVTPPGVHIDGSVIATNALSVTLAGIVTVGKNITLQGTTGQVEIAAVNIGGNAQIVGSLVGPLSIESNNILGNVAVNGNNTVSTINVIANNTIGGNLVCVQNTPGPNNIVVVPPPTPLPNTVGGNKVGQCTGL